MLNRVVSRYIVPASYLLYDTFTGADATLDFHTAEIGAPWVVSTNSNATSIVTGGKLTKDSTNLASLYYSTATLNANGFAEVDMRMRSATGNVGLALRFIADTNNYVWWRYNTGDSLWSIRETISGTASQLASASQSLTIDQVYRVRLETSGTQARLLVDGAVVIDWTTITNTNSGRVGVRMSGTMSPTVGFDFDNLQAGNL